MRRTLYGQRNMWSSWLLKRMPRPPPPPLPLTKRHNISHTTKGRKGREREGGERGGKKERLKSFQQPTNEAGKLPAYSSELLKLARLPCPSIHPVPSDAAPSIHPSPLDKATENSDLSEEDEVKVKFRPGRGHRNCRGKTLISSCRSFVIAREGRKRSVKYRVRL